jgi:hypothetical protein
MDIWIPVLVSAITGFIAGLLASIFASGIRKMLATFIVRRKLCIGHITKGIESTGTYWYIPIIVKANSLWNLLISSVNDVKAIISFTERKENRETVNLKKQGLWINEIDGSLDNLGIGTQRDIRITEDSADGILRPVNEMTGEILKGNQDISLQLKSGNASLGYWLFENAIISGFIQERIPVKMRCEPLTPDKGDSQS